MATGWQRQSVHAGRGDGTGGGGRAWAQPSIYEAVPNSRRISGMARLHLSSFKLARVIPIAGWAARFHGRSSNDLWMLDKSALFTRKSLKINELWITRCAQKPISPSLNKCGIPSALIRCSLFLRLPLFKRCLPFRGETLTFCSLFGGELFF